MRAYDLILKKRNGQELTKFEIESLINGYMSGNVTDYQMAAFLMAVFFKGMTPAETSELTTAIVNSGEIVDLSGITGRKIDKHSTGGVGDKTTLVLGPLVAAAGVPVAKMSGRGLGHTGGTIDKLDSIKGFNTSLSKEEFIANVNKIKIAIGGQTGNLAPADKKLYALRDVTATVDSLPLIASSIMSKKIAAGADAIVLDVKAGSGAFMKTVNDAVELAKAMVQIGSLVGRETAAVITDMDQPLGNAVGNSMEVTEAINCLKGNGPDDLTELCLTLGSHMVFLGDKAGSPEEARSLLEKILQDGQGLEKLRQLVENQGGDVRFIDEPELMPKADQIVDVKASDNGYVKRIEAEQIGLAAMTLGAGRETKESEIDLSAGIVLTKKIGDKVTAGDTIAVMHTNNREKIAAANQMITEAFVITQEKTDSPKLILGLVTKDKVEVF